ncbi:MAG: nickel/cobalt transporter [Alphaproteobacteria bacterium]|nr:nickel/cobalt transporter [Alphaproteobacteria bacterium]
MSTALAAESSIMSFGWSDLMSYIRESQQSFHRQLADAIRAVQEGGIIAVWTLISLSFLYGVFHAAGPGHGKAIIGTYMASQESLARKGIYLSFASAFMQGAVAIVLIQAVTWIFDISRREAQGLNQYLELLSFLLIAAIGVFLIYRAYKSYILLNRTSIHDHTHDDHAHDHDHAKECSSCGHSHAITPRQLQHANSWKESFSLVASVGIRPCSGSLLVLIFAELIGLTWAGIGAVLAISLGTAITVSCLALMATYLRKTAMYLANKTANNMVSHLSILATFAGGLIITSIGISLFIDAKITDHPLF